MLNLFKIDVRKYKVLGVLTITKFSLKVTLLNTRGFPSIRRKRDYHITSRNEETVGAEWGFCRKML